MVHDRPQGDGVPLPLSEKADRLCDRFEAELKAGRAPSVEAYLREAAPAELPALHSELVFLLNAYGVPQAGETTAGYLTRLHTPGQGVCEGADGSLASSGTEAHSPRSAGGPLESESAQPLSDHAALLVTTHPFSELPRSLIRRLLAEMSEKHFDRGATLLRQGESCPYLLVLIEGETEVLLERPDGAEEVGATRGATMLGEMSLLSGEPCSATVVATKPVRALALSADKFYQLAARHHTLWLALGLLTAHRLGRQAIDILAGKVLGGYRIERCIGRGGMAMVYEARHLGSGERVALKMLSHRLCQDVEAQRRFEREVEICRALRHPNIAPVYDSFTAFATNFMVVGYCDGETLANTIEREGPLPEPRVRDVLGQLASALAYAHAQGVCHRDLKPSNIMIERLGKVVLMDFGLAKSIAAPEMTSVGQIIGTPRYMPPEQLSGEPVDRRADLFALGCIAYELLTGKPLFSQSTYQEILNAQLHFTLPAADEIRAGLSADLYGVLRQSLARAPEDRVLDLERIARMAASR
jgi:CRP-like cAMP-binding protein